MEFSEFFRVVADNELLFVKKNESGRRWPLKPPPPNGTARTGQVSRSSISD
jgi:hypothetical protein